jgi:hypothetical protein
LLQSLFGFAADGRRVRVWTRTVGLSAAEGRQGSMKLA